MMGETGNDKDWVEKGMRKDRKGWERRRKGKGGGR